MSSTRGASRKEGEGRMLRKEATKINTLQLDHICNGLKSVDLLILSIILI